MNNCTKGKKPATCGSWPSPITAELLTSRGVGLPEPKITNVDGQVVFSSAEVFNGNAQAVTEGFQMFFGDVYNWIVDPNYLDQAITAPQPALSYGLIYGAQYCSYVYGFPVCASYANYEIQEVVTLAKLGLTFVNEAQAKIALAEEFGLPNYDTHVCVFVCELQVYYGYDSSICANYGGQGLMMLILV